MKLSHVFGINPEDVSGLEGADIHTLEQLANCYSLAVLSERSGIPTGRLSELSASAEIRLDSLLHRKQILRYIGAATTIFLIVIIAWSHRRGLSPNLDKAIESYNRGNELYRQGNYTQAISFYDDSLKLRPDRADTHNNYGLALYATGDHGGALIQLRDAVNLSPAGPYASYNYALALEQKQLQAAAAQYEKMLSAKPGDAKVHFRLGLANYKLGKYEASIVELQKAIELQPNSPDFHFVLAEVFGDNGDYDKAVDQYNAVLKLSPDDVGAINNIGVLFAEKGDEEDATNAYRRALAFAPNDTLVRRNLIVSLARRGLKEELLGELQKYVELHPKDPRTPFMRQFLNDEKK